MRMSWTRLRLQPGRTRRGRERGCSMALTPGDAGAWYVPNRASMAEHTKAAEEDTPAPAPAPTSAHMAAH